MCIKTLKKIAALWPVTMIWSFTADTSIHPWFHCIKWPFGGNSQASISSILFPPHLGWQAVTLWQSVEQSHNHRGWSSQYRWSCGEQEKTFAVAKKWQRSAPTFQCLMWFKVIFNIKGDMTIGQKSSGPPTGKQSVRWSHVNPWDRNENYNCKM